MQRTTLLELYEQHRGKVSDKWSLYLREYERLLRPLADQPIRMLEIGIQNGGSLEIWSRFFERAERIVGCDINPDCAKLRYDDPRIAVVVGDSNTDKAEIQITTESSRFDLIIDDGSHRSGDIIRAFARYFEHLNDGGLFIVEDLHCSYFQAFEGGLFDPASSLSFFKRLADLVSHEHWGLAEPRKTILASFMRKHGFDIREELLCHIHSIEFINSLCVIRKNAPTENVIGKRFIAGLEEIVVPGHLGLHGSASPIADEKANLWTAVALLPEDERVATQSELQSAKTELGRLREVDLRLHHQSRRLESTLDTLAERNAAYEQLADQLGDAQSRVLGLTSAVAEADRQNTIQQQQLSDLRRQLDEVFSSKSWRMTRWVRWLDRRLSRIRRDAKKLGRAIRRGESPVAVFQHSKPAQGDSGASATRVAWSAGASSVQSSDGLDTVAGDLMSSGAIGAAAILGLTREGQMQAASKFQPYKPLFISVDESRGAAPKLQILLPSLKQEHATGGPNTAFVLGVLLARRGIRVGFVSCTVSPDRDLGPIRNHLQTLTGFRPEDLSIELADASDPAKPLRIGHNDVFLATAWWTAQPAHSVLSQTKSSRFYYLIQDFEPIFYSLSENWCQAVETYDFDHVPIVNTTLLRDYLRDAAIGRFADHAFADRALVFEPAVDKTLFHVESKARRMPRRLLFYARPNIAQRNLFGMGVAALRAGVTAGLFGDAGWEFLGIGENFDAVSLGRGYKLVPAPWLDLAAYAAQMRSADLLLSLMLSPHPSYPPLEMAACGGTVVTTVYGSKTARRLAELSPNIIGVDPSIEALVWGLQRALLRSADAASSAVPIDLPETWQQSLESVLPRLMEELERDGIVPISIAGDLPAATVSTALALIGDDGDFYRQRRLACRDLYRAAPAPGLISLVTTVDDTDPMQLADLAHTIFAQDANTAFEWVLFDNASSNPATLALMERLRADPRVQFGQVANKLGIVGGMRWCLERATGRYIVPMAGDALLFPHCLRTLCAFIEQAGFPALLYTDEDKTDGQRHRDLYAKPDWDPVLFAHSGYVANLTVIDREKALRLDCYSDTRVDGNHGWDSFTRFVVAGYTPLHLAETLYTGRMHAASTSSDDPSPSQVDESQSVVVQNFLRGKVLQDRYEVQPSPVFGGTRFYPLADVGISWLATIPLSSASDGSVSLPALIDAVTALPEAVTFVHLLDDGCTVIDPGWAIEARAMSEIFPDTVMIGGRIHDGAVLREAAYVFGYGGMIGCPDVGRPLGDSGYAAQMGRPHSVAAVSARHCVVQRDFLLDALVQLPGRSDLRMLGPWLGAVACERDSRVVFTPFFDARIAHDGGAQPPAELAVMAGRFGHLIHRRLGYAPRLDRSGSRPYAAGMAEAAVTKPVYADYFADHLAQRLKRSTAMPSGVAPISLLTAVYEKTDEALFRETVACVAAQTSKPFEWVVLAQGPIIGRLEKTLDELDRNGIIRLLRHQENLGIMGGLRLCLEAASAEYAMVLDADDLLTVDALALLAAKLVAEPDAQVVYSDEDLLIDGSPKHPYTRPDFDPVLLSAHSYIWHAIVFRRTTALDLGVFTDPGAEYAQDWHTLLRFMLAGHVPRHLPEVLYRWRRHEQSVSNSGQTFEGSLASVRHLLGEVAASTGHRELYEVLPYPYRVGDIDYFIKRLSTAAPSVLRIDLGARDGRAACHEATGHFPFPEQVTLAGDRGCSGIQALEEAVAAASAEFVLLLGAGVTLMTWLGIWQAIKQFEFLPDALGVGGPLTDAGGVVRSGAIVETPDGRLVDPTRGRPLSDAGPFSLALKPHCVSLLSPDLMLLRRSVLLDALRARAAGVTLRGLGPWLGHYGRRQSKRLVYEPLLVAGIDRPSALIGDPLEALEVYWHSLGQGELGAVRQIEGLSAFAWHADHYV